MNTRRNVKGWLTAGFVVAGLLAACGGSDSGSGVPLVASVYAVTNLVSDGPAVSASHTDANLKNGWGLAFNPKGFAWVAANGTSKSTLYDGNGVPQSLVVSVPATSDADPTGIVFNATQDFKVTQGSASAPAAFIFVQAIGDRIYVAYTLRAATGDDGQGGAGVGVVAVFDTGGTLIKQLAVGGALNAPWGMAMAPANFGAVSGALLVGNFGDGKINAFDPVTGNLVGTLGKADGTPIVVDGLWGIAFGNDVQSQPSNTLFFASGPADESHGLYGRIDLK